VTVAAFGILTSGVCQRRPLGRGQRAKRPVLLIRRAGFKGDLGFCQFSTQVNGMVEPGNQTLLDNG